MWRRGSIVFSGYLGYIGLQGSGFNGLVLGSGIFGCGG